ncbi:MAG: hypothetical protein ACXVII_34470 [Solirubrobacteraceae bacterium]
MADRLAAGDRLNKGDSRTSTNGKVELVMQTDGNLALYRTDTWKALWASNTWGKPTTHADMQGDGNLVVYGDDGHAYWGSGTSNQPNAYAVVQDDGNFVIYKNGAALWSTRTVQPPWPDWAAATGDVHVATGHWMNTNVSLFKSGILQGDTHLWSTIDLLGFHGSTTNVVYDNKGEVVWPADLNTTKHTWGVDGHWIQPDGIHPSWVNLVPASIMQGGVGGVYVHNYLDPQNMLIPDLKLTEKLITDAIPIITVALGGSGGKSK